jgi:hypothetical protein
MPLDREVLLRPVNEFKSQSFARRLNQWRSALSPSLAKTCSPLQNILLLLKTLILSPRPLQLSCRVLPL